MKIVIQRVKSASCTIDGEIYSSINQGYLILVGLTETDNREIVEKIADKLVKLRLFEDENGLINLDLNSIGGSILSISQFTLYADCKKGNRPSFTKAMKPDEAKQLYDEFNNILKAKVVNVQTGIFGADMKIDLLNDGPVTIILDSKEIING